MQRTARSFAFVLCFVAASLLVAAAPNEPLARMEAGCALKGLYARLVDFHTGTTPCLRYHNECDPKSDGSVDRTASMLVAMGITPAELAASEAAMVKWAQQAEAKFHQLPEEEEFAKALAATKPVRAGPPSFEVPLFRPLSRVLAGKDKLASLSPEQGERARKAWEAHSVPLSRSFQKVLVAMKTQVNRARMERFTSVIQAHYQAKRTFPAPGEVELPLDADGRPLAYRVEDGKAVFGIAADYPHGWLALDAKGLDTYHPPVRSGCELKDGASHALDATTLKWSPSSARILPAFAEGQLQGIKLFSIEEGSYFDRLCLKNGDVISTVNGELVSADAANLSAVRGKHHLRILRDGKVFSITVGPK